MRDLRKNFWLFFENYWQLFVLAGVVLIFFWKVILAGLVPLPGDFIVGVYHPWLDYKWGYIVGVPVKNPITTDVVSLIFPEQMLAIDMMRSGHWPLWNSRILAGTPLFANLQAAPFSITNILYFLTDELTAWSFQIILQHVFAAGFMYALLRYWKISKIGSLFGGVAFGFSGFNLIFSQWNGHALTSAFVPLAILLADRLLDNGRYVDVCTLAVVMVLQLLSGYPQTSLYTVVAMGFLVMMKGGWRRIPKFALAGVFALGLSAFQILPTMELWRLSQRGLELHPYDWAFLPWVKIVTLVAPDYFGNHATANYWGPQDYTSNTAYVGVIVMLLGIVGVNLFRRKKGAMYLALLGGFSLFMAFPTPVSVFLWKNDILGMRASSAHRITVLFVFAMAGLAGFGIDYLRSSKRPKIRIALILGWLLVGGFALLANNVVAQRNLIMPGMILVVGSSILIFKRKGAVGFVFVIMVFELTRFGWKYTPFSPREFVYPQTPVLQFLQSQEGIYRVTGNNVIPNNLRTPYGLESLEGYETIQSLRMAQFVSSLNKSGVDLTNVRRYGIIDNDVSHLLDLANTRYYLALDKDVKRFEAPRFHRVFEDGSVVVFESMTALPRAFMVYDWEVFDEDEEILSELLREDYPIGSRIILEEEVGLEKFEKKNENEIEYLVYEGQESVLKVRTERDGLLFVSEAMYPGWKAFIDGKEKKVYRANYAFRAVVVPEGEHMVKFVYSPESFTNGLKISGLSLVLMLGSIMIVRKHGK